MSSEVLRVAVAGLGGFAGEHHAALAALEADGVCRVIATCDPKPPNVDRFRLQDRGVEVFGTLDELLAAHGPSLDLLTLPTPIPLHAHQHRLAVEAGVPVYLEKPPSLWWPEFKSMLETEKGARCLTQVGFNFVGDPFRRELKRRALDGDFGALNYVSLHGVWPRDRVYYDRNDWAGRLRVDDRWVLDSVIGNAMAHYVQNLLFWCGSSGVDSVGSAVELRAWLGRTHPIESFDTALVEAKIENGVTLRIGVTHAWAGVAYEREELKFERATLVFDRWNEVRVHWAGGRIETLRSAIPDQSAMLRFNLAEHLSYIRGRRARPTTTLTDAAPFVALCDLSLVSSGTIHAMDEFPELAEFVAEGLWPGFVPPTASDRDLARLPEVAERIRFELSR